MISEKTIKNVMSLMQQDDPSVRIDIRVFHHPRLIDPEAETSEFEDGEKGLILICTNQPEHITPGSIPVYPPVKDRIMFPPMSAEEKAELFPEDEEE